YHLSSLPLNKRSWLYSGESFAGEHGLADEFASARHTWVAAYRAKEPTLGHTLWQCTDGETGSHITDWPGAGRCDTNLYHGTLAQWSALVERGGRESRHHPADRHRGPVRPRRLRRRGRGDPPGFGPVLPVRGLHLVRAGRAAVAAALTAKEVPCPNFSTVR